VELVIYAQDYVELLPEVDRRHVATNQPHARKLLPPNREHLLGEVDAGDVVIRLQLLEDRAGAARELENGLRPRMVLLQQRADVRRMVGAIPLGRVVEPRVGGVPG